MTDEEALASLYKRYWERVHPVNAIGCLNSDVRTLSLKQHVVAPFRVGWILENRRNLPGNFLKIGLMRTCRTKGCVNGKHWTLEPGVVAEPRQAPVTKVCPTCQGTGTIRL